MTTKETEKSIQEIWNLFKETDKGMERLEKIVENTSRAVYALTGKWSRFVEGLIAPATERLFKERWIEVDRYSR
jgi:DNA-binding PadR family transcriptional regulator